MVTIIIITTLKVVTSNIEKLSELLINRQSAPTKVITNNNFALITLGFFERLKINTTNPTAISA